ncbi:hypothetical protein CPB83DRAFT_836884 [Crepidotus variabilis]|uniref:Uncharacterized protein n=1 Tax=Crepidotus variabilis TaxID=179855 RepID=A0A9P6ECY0_9AGAR|nr:hypothetical protein CPB83DRAFT_836884 [Crepidotus variabilis]
MCILYSARLGAIKWINGKTAEDRERFKSLVTARRSCQSSKSASGPLPQNLATDNCFLYDFVDKSLERKTANSPDPQQALVETLGLLDEVLNTSEEEQIGVKPRKDDKYTLVKSILDANYTIQIWLTSRSRRELCLDFVSAASQEPINTPTGVELWMSPCSSLPSVKMYTMEEIIAPLMPDFKVPVGEKHLLVEKQTIRVRRPGKEDIALQVPARPLPPPIVKNTAQVIEFSYSNA